MKHVISLGAGVQSSTMALMAAAGEITPMPDCAIFADTQAEPKKVYDWLDWLEKQLPFPVYRVTGGNLRDDIYAALRGDARRKSHLPQPPFYSGGDGQEGMLFRKCTRHYKIDQIRKKQRDLLGLQPRQRAGREIRITAWIGFSIDESHRVKPSEDKWVKNRWPLLELGISRQQCSDWVWDRFGKRPPKSACTFCPYHDNLMWRDMRDNDSCSWLDAVAMDRAIRGGIPLAGAHFPLFLHRDTVPLDEVDLRTAEDAGQQAMFDEKGFAVECEGMCGV